MSENHATKVVGEPVVIDLKKLTAPFPKEAHKSRTVGGGRALTYVQGHVYIHRLNDATGNCWNLAVDKIERTQVDADNVMLMAYVTLEIPGLGSRSHVGVQSVHARGGEDLVKGAVTDALKKAASLFGVGLELYGPDYEGDDERDHVRPAPTQPKPQPKPQAKPQPQPSAAKTNGAPPAASAEQEDPDMHAAEVRTQLNRDLHGIAAKRNLSHTDLRNVCMFFFPHLITSDGERITITSMTQLTNDMLLAMIEHLDPALDDRGVAHCVPDLELAHMVRDWRAELKKCKTEEKVLALGQEMRAAGISRATHPDLFITVKDALDKLRAPKAQRQAA
jgi:hypothetical protein